jgi:hypothetical protein
MKTFKQYQIMFLNGIMLSCIFTLHHFSFGIYWAAPEIEGRRRISLSLHLPFFIGSVSFWGKDG